MKRLLWIFLSLVFFVVGLAILWVGIDTDWGKRVNSNYDGIAINHVVKKDMEYGKGMPAKVGDRLKAHISLWVYAPAEPGNRGELLYKTEEPVEILVEAMDPKHFAYYLIGARVGGIRHLIVPEKYKQIFKSPEWQWPDGAILFFEYRIYEIN